MTLFKKVTITTPESVELEFTLAGIGNRVIAVVVDYVLLSLLWLLAVWVTNALRLPLGELAARLGDDSESTGLWITAIVMLITFALYCGYFVAFESAWQGQTPGKRFAKIRVIRDTGQPEGVLQATLRSLLRPVDDILFLGFFCILLSQQERRLGDWLGGTLVVQTERPIGKGSLTVSDAAKTLAPALTELAQLENMLPDDFTVIRDYLLRRSTLTRPARQALSVRLARQVRAIIELKELPQENLPADEFLEAVYWAYQEKFGRDARSVSYPS